MIIITLYTCIETSIIIITRHGQKVLDNKYQSTFSALRFRNIQRGKTPHPKGTGDSISPQM